MVSSTPSQLERSGSKESSGSEVPLPRVELQSRNTAKPPRHVERICLVILATLAVLYTLYFARALFLPATLAVLLALVLKPLVNRLKSIGIPYVVSASFIFIALLAVAAVSGAQLIEPAKHWIAEAPDFLQNLSNRTENYFEPLQHIQKAKEQVDKATSLPGQEEAVPVRIEQPRLASRMVNSTGGFIAGATITVVLGFFFLVSADRFLQKLVDVVPTWQGKREIVNIVAQIQHKMSAYLGAITLINIGLGIVIGLGLWAIGMPNPLLWGVLAALLNFIPLAGLVMGTAIVFLVAVAEFDSLTHAALAPAIYLIANGIEANLITPAVLGRSISLNPIVIMLAIFVAGWMWGIGGIFLAVPLLLILKIACDNIASLSSIAVFLAR